jgi:ATP-dependent protease Clp ATPase subunit|tara:strand:+ start:101 stop:274 length:174 start_codon:yes stop_codon:yes gene_type:complete
MVKITEVEELKQQVQIAIDCLDNICSTHANSAAYRDMAKESLQQILLRKENAVSNEK